MHVQSLDSIPDVWPELAFLAVFIHQSEMYSSTLVLHSFVRKLPRFLDRERLYSLNQLFLTITRGGREGNIEYQPLI
jgi:hypothetical protein